MQRVPQPCCLKKERERSLSSDRPRSYEKGCPPPQGSPGSLIATQAINGRTNGRTIFVADAHRDDGKRFVVHADEKLTAFVELETAIRASNGHDRAAVPV